MADEESKYLIYDVEKMPNAESPARVFPPQRPTSMFLESKYLQYDTLILLIVGCNSTWNPLKLQNDEKIVRNGQREGKRGRAHDSLHVRDTMRACSYHIFFGL